MYEFLKNVSQDNGYVFTYARRDFANLYDEDIDKEIPHIFLDPVVIESTYDEFGNIESKTYSGHFMLLMSSDLADEDYEERYQTHIKPLLQQAETNIIKEVACTNLEIRFWRTTEIINVFDFNFDGLIINYQLTE